MLSPSTITLAHSDPHGATSSIRVELGKSLAGFISAKDRISVTYEARGGVWKIEIGTAQDAIFINIDLADLVALASSLDPLFKLLARELAALDRTLFDSYATDRTVKPKLNKFVLHGAVPTQVTHHLAKTMADAAAVIVSGLSGAGKTTAVTQVCRSFHTTRAARTLFVDLAVGMPHLEEILRFVLLSSGQRHILVVDNVQARLSSLPWWRWFIELAAGAMDRQFVLITWPALRQNLADIFLTAEVVNCPGGVVLTDLVRSRASHLTQPAIDDLLALVGSDVFVGTIAIEGFLKTGQLPSQEWLVQHMSELVNISGMPRQQREALYDLCCVNALDIPMAKSFLTDRYGSSTVQALLNRDFVRIDGTDVRAGHRSRATLLAFALRAHLPPIAVTRWRKVILDYLQSLDKAKLYAILRAIDSSQIVEGKTGGRKASSADMLTTISNLLNRLKGLIENDPTWNRNFASASFAVRTLIWGAPEVADATVRFVRGAIQVSNHSLIFPEGYGTEWGDFGLKALPDAMSEQDRSLDKLPSLWERAADVDRDRFYQNWMLGLLLGLEAAALPKDKKRLNALLGLAETWSKGSDFFYPSRAPWVTARVLLGLAACGETIDSNPTIRRIASSLLSRKGMNVPSGQAIWLSGTGSWNSDEQCSALCALALSAVGVPKAVILEASATNALNKKLLELDPSADEIDLLLIIECLAEFRCLTADAELVLQKITAKYLDMATGLSHSLDAASYQEESSKGPFVITALTNILWNRMSSELDDYIQFIAPDFVLNAGQEINKDQQVSDLEQRIGYLMRQYQRVVESKETAFTKSKNAGIRDTATLAELRKPIEDYNDRIERLEQIRTALATGGAADFLELKREVEELENNDA